MKKKRKHYSAEEEEGVQPLTESNVAKHESKDPAWHALLAEVASKRSLSMEPFEVDFLWMSGVSGRARNWEARNAKRGGFGQPRPASNSRSRSPKALNATLAHRRQAERVLEVDPGTPPRDSLLPPPAARPEGGFPSPPTLFTPPRPRPRSSPRPSSSAPPPPPARTCSRARTSPWLASAAT